MNLAQYAPWLVYGFVFGMMVWAVVFCYVALRRSMAMGAGFYDV